MKSYRRRIFSTGLGAVLGAIFSGCATTTPSVVHYGQLPPVTLIVYATRDEAENHCIRAGASKADTGIPLTLWEYPHCCYLPGRSEIVMYDGAGCLAHELCHHEDGGQDPGRCVKLHVK